jgi:glutamine amidotransferase
MTDDRSHPVVIIDYGMGNLFSVQQAFSKVGIPATITSSKIDIMEAMVVVIPGVGAFGDAMNALHKLDLVSPIKDLIGSNTLIVGICLGMELLMSESEEFGIHKGLDVVSGPVARLKPNPDDKKPPKVPHVGWSRICSPNDSRDEDPWQDTLLDSVPQDEFMYFVHSYYVRPLDENIILSVSQYGDVEFCSSFSKGNIFGCQFHPERSGIHGLTIYENIYAHCNEKTKYIDN